MNGTCGSTNGVITASYPTANWCTTGTKVNVDTTGTDGVYNWSCNGSGGGTNVSCSASKSTIVLCTGQTMYGENVTCQGKKIGTTRYTRILYNSYDSGWVAGNVTYGGFLDCSYYPNLNYNGPGLAGTNTESSGNADSQTVFWGICSVNWP